MIYKVTAIGDNALDVIDVDDDEEYDDDDEDDDSEYYYYPTYINPTYEPAVPASASCLGTGDVVKYEYVHEVTVGKNVRSIGSNAFRGVSKIIFKSKNLKKISSSAFINTDDKLVIKVPSSKYGAYKKLLSGKGQSENAVIKK